MTPNIAIVHVRLSARAEFPVWLPLFLLWIPLLLLSPLVLLVAGCVCLSWRGAFTLARRSRPSGRLLCSLPGTDVRVTTDGNHVTVRIL